ncbi:TorF family putative porin [Pseudomonas sp. BGr12]|uniref:TorF family putative porin n=1 Tax=Pseudomonas sp. BGr12 TaxID=2936269 RepID=UPI002559F55A|nr:TorF family putative porin [Pseudomonas sp. BJa5]MDL2428463.1 TorF family putative porin [Pseudomonas sp. BJa5]
MNKISLLPLVGMVIATPQAASAVSLSENLNLLVNMGIYSESVSRGLSASQRKPVLGLDLTLFHSSGVYAGVWTSGVDMKGADADYEDDYYAGFVFQPAEAVIVDFGYLRYTYPESSFFNMTEYYAKLNVYDFSAGVYYSNDYAGDQSTVYSYVGYHIDLPYESAADLRYGYTDYKDPAFISASGNVRESYREWEAKLSKTAFGLDWFASYLGTDLSEAECQSSLGDKESCGPRMFFGVTKTF